LCIVVPLPPGTYPLAVNDDDDDNDDNNNNNNNNNNKYQYQRKKTDRRKANLAPQLLSYINV
jgi:hypothetical protein